MRVLFFLFFIFTLVSHAALKTPSDVYSEALVLKQIVIALREAHGVREALKDIAPQKDKLPRHVLQKSIEVLRKVDKYREINGMGGITVPPVPPRDITPQDVYNNVSRLKKEVFYLLTQTKKVELSSFVYKQFYSKTPSDVYRELWMISLGFDALLGQGFTPTDVYAQAKQAVDLIEFLRLTQRENITVTMPPLKENQHPNHALYKSVALIQKIHRVEKKLWMQAVPVPKIEQKVISPTEVYDSLQTVIAELNRIARRLGVERHFELQVPKEKKTPADVVQLLEYAIALLPEFSVEKTLNQYPKATLIKSPNDVYALSEYILQKIEYIKVQKGIHAHAKDTTYIYGLKPIHVYEKGIEDLEKVAKLKKLEGFAPSEVPDSPSTKITPSEVYELILRLDDELHLIYHDSLKERTILDSYRDLLYKKHYTKKTPSDVYDNLWKISYELDAILNEEYTPNETYVLAKKIESDVKKMSQFFLGKDVVVTSKRSKSKRPSDVYFQSLKLLKKLEFIKERGNFKSAKISVPQDDIITPTTVYNALRLISGTISEIDVYYEIERSKGYPKLDTEKTPTDVYELVKRANIILSTVLEESSYED